MVGAFTTAAVVNHSMCPPEKPVAALRYMPNARPMDEAPAPPKTEEQLQAESDYGARVLELAAYMKANDQEGVKRCLTALSNSSSDSMGSRATSTIVRK